MSSVMGSFLEYLPGVLVGLGTMIVLESVEQSTPAHMVPSELSAIPEVSIPVGEKHMQTFLSMSH